MAKLEWDKTGERFYETGVKDVVLYLLDAENAYSTGVAWNGVISISENPDGADANDLWADNIKYASLRSAETLSLSLEAYMSPAEFDECDGTAVPATGVKVGQQKRKAFGLCYRTEQGNDTMTDTDDGYKLHLVYGCVATPSEKSYETINDSPDAITFSWDIDTTPVALPQHPTLLPTSLIVVDSLKANATKLENLKTALYGGENSTARLPLPDEVITMLSGT